MAIFLVGQDNGVLPPEVRAATAASTEVAAVINTKVSTAVALLEPKITAGTSLQYLRGDKTWQTLPTTSTATGDSAIRWNASSRSWPARGTGPFGQVFLSTNDATATAPNDVNLLKGDRWLRFKVTA